MDSPTWAIQLGIATPFVLALGFIGKWLVGRLDKAEARNQELYDKIIEEVVPALKSSTTLGERTLEQQKELAQDRSALVARMEIVLELEKQLLEKSEELRKAELAAAARAQRRGGG